MKTSSPPRGIPMTFSAREFARYGFQILSGARATHERRVAQWRERDLQDVFLPDRCYHILDLANGRLRPQYSILRAAGHQVYGIDQINGARSYAIEMAYSFSRWAFNRQIGSRAKDMTLVCGDVSFLPFPSTSFDLVTSVAAFEHFLNVPQVVSEAKRLLKPGGILWVLIHLFTSPSGGHNISATEIPLRHIPRGIEPWDHLRERRLPFHVPLNEWRRDQYLSTFSRHLEILNHYCALQEGNAWLTPEIREKLAAYDQEELTCGSYVIVARKPSSA